jgi:hypothetical protein
MQILQTIEINCGSEPARESDLTGNKNPPGGIAMGDFLCPE